MLARVDFVEWCGRVLTAMVEVRNSAPQARSMGMRDLRSAEAMYGHDAVFPTGFSGTQRHAALLDALIELQQAGVIESRDKTFWKLGETGERAVADQVALWRNLANIESRTNAGNCLMSSTASVLGTKTIMPGWNGSPWPSFSPNSDGRRDMSRLVWCMLSQES